MSNLPLNVCYYGKEDPLPEQRELRSGLLSVTLEEGDLLNVRWGGHEILHRIYVAVRDHNWGTVARRLSKLEVISSSNSFQVTYLAEHQRGDIDFVWKADIRGTAEDKLAFSMEGEARSTFLRNRIGFCLLHSARECSGKRFTVIRDDGSSARGTFPRAISAGDVLPGTESMRGLSFEAQPGLWAEIRFFGDIFQMEDQRNWTDSTYKTFCTPLSLPCPVEITNGTRVSQSIILTLMDQRAARPARLEEKRLVVSVGNLAQGSIPRIGLGMASHRHRLSWQEIARLRALRLSHLRVDLRLSDPQFPALLSQASEEAKRVGAPLEVALFLSASAETELRLLSDQLSRIQAEICTWLIFPAAEDLAERWIILAREILKPWNPEARFGSGTNAYFYHLSKSRVPISASDLICYSIQPQEHAFDNLSLVETLEMQAETMANARRLAGGLPIAISPVTLKPRFNPNATAASSHLQAEELPAEVDVRQMSLFAAAWTLGSLRSLSESGVYSVTYYETTGWRGVMEQESGSPMPDQFRSIPGSVFPLYHVLADVTEFSGAHLIPTNSSHSLKVAGLTLCRDGKKRTILANLTGLPQTLIVEGLSDDVSIAELNENNIIQAMTSSEGFRAQPSQYRRSHFGQLEVTLPRYAISRMDMT